MNYFQLLILTVLCVVLAGTLVASVKGWATRRETLLWSLVCLIAGTAAIRPQMTVPIANALGIGRGADLILYCAVVLMLVGFWMIYIRLRHLRRQITLLVRRLAIEQTKHELSRR